jgi:heptosyltransferase III
VSNQTPHIILSRTDGIGDVMLTLPLAGWLKKNIPECRVDMLVRSYTAPIAHHCEHIDTVLCWDDTSQEHQETIHHVFGRATAILHVFPHFTIAQFAKHSGIKKRIGTSHRWYHWMTCNLLVSLGRKNSPLHEAQLNCMLAESLVGAKHIPTLQEIPALYGFSAGIARVSDVPISSTDKPSKHTVILHPFSKRTVILHPLSQGSAPRWNWMKWSMLADMLCEQGWRVVVTGSKAEGEQLRYLFNALSHRQKERQVINMCGTLTLDELISHIATSDALIAASTGPLHIASALGIKAIGLYVARKPLHAGRWGALGTDTHIVERGEMSCKSCTVEQCACINRIQPEDILALLEPQVQKE